MTDRSSLPWDYVDETIKGISLLDLDMPDTAKNRGIGIIKDLSRSRTFPRRLDFDLDEVLSQTVLTLHPSLDFPLRSTFFVSALWIELQLCGLIPRGIFGLSSAFSATAGAFDRSTDLAMRRRILDFIGSCLSRCMPITDRTKAVVSANAIIAYAHCLGSLSIEASSQILEMGFETVDLDEISDEANPSADWKDWFEGKANDRRGMSICVPFLGSA